MERMQRYPVDILFRDGTNDVRDDYFFGPESGGDFFRSNLAGLKAMNIPEEHKKKILGETGKVIRSGNWHGNDTIWRMILDLNKILLYGNPDGTMRPGVLKTGSDISVLSMPSLPEMDSGPLSRIESNGLSDLRDKPRVDRLGLRWIVSAESKIDAVRSLSDTPRGRPPRRARRRALHRVAADRCQGAGRAAGVHRPGAAAQPGALRR
jgi:hypothetical protein